MTAEIRNQSERDDRALDSPGAWLMHRIIVDVAELPDRSSPEDEPDMMLVDSWELRTILENNGVCDLLNALKALVRDLSANDEDGLTEFAESMSLALNAISKAEGR